MMKEGKSFKFERFQVSNLKLKHNPKVHPAVSEIIWNGINGVADVFPPKLAQAL